MGKLNTMKAPSHCHTTDTLLTVLFLLYAVLHFHSSPAGIAAGFQHAEESLRATVKVEVFYQDTTGRSMKEKGAGAILSEDGKIVTNYHTIRQAGRILVTLYGGITLPATILQTSPAYDLALIKIEGSRLPAFSFGATPPLQPGDPIFAIGHPHHLDFSLTGGIVSGLNRALSPKANSDIPPYFIQTDVPINQGCSGGPLIDQKGVLVGINTAILSKSGRFEGYAFAIPIEHVRSIFFGEAGNTTSTKGIHP